MEIPTVIAVIIIGGLLLWRVFSILNTRSAHTKPLCTESTEVYLWGLKVPYSNIMLEPSSSLR